MTARRHTAPRVARLELRARLASAARAGELLGQKEDVLRRERARLVAHADRAAADCERAMAAADDALGRALRLGGRPGLDRLGGVPAGPAYVDAAWRQAMGVSYPGEVHVQPGPPPELASTAAFGPAIEAFAQALEVAARCAAATAALGRIEAELATTRRRRRAIEERLVPRVRQELHTIELHLDEVERDEAVRVRWASGRRGG